MQFRKKPVLIEATQLRASAFDKCYPNPEHIPGVIYDPVQRCAFIKTLEGTMRADIGDWIITGVMGERYPCKPDIFAMTYEPVAPQAESETFESELRSFAETPEQVAFVEKLIAPQAEQKREPHWIDPVFSEWWSSDKADEHADNPFQADSAAAWAYAGWMAAQRAEPKRPQIEVSLAAGLGYWGVALCVGAQSFALLAEFATLTEAEEYAERLRAALGITGDSDAD
jgi:hypothetical protein